MIHSQAASDKYLQETKHLNFTHHKIASSLTRCVKPSMTNTQKAIAIHDFVRDEIKFGFSRNFWNETASNVLTNKIGFCNNKSTLFVAMLRAAKIPARIRVFALSKDVLKNILDPGTKYVDHSIVEVFLNDKWIQVDSHIVDTKLSESAQKKLPREIKLGYGIRQNSCRVWDGKSDCFSQLDKLFIKEDFGIFNDIGEFYKSNSKHYNKINLIQRFFYRLSYKGINDKINNIINF